MSTKYISTNIQATTLAGSIANVHSGQTAAVIQVSPKMSGGSHAILPQNGQHVIFGKLVTADSTIGSDGHGGSDSITLQNNGPTVQAIYQYVEAAPETTIYTSGTSNGQVLSLPLRQYQDYTPNLYTTTMGAQGYYQSNSPQLRDLSSVTQSTSGGNVVTAASGIHSHAQLVTHQGTTYLVQGAQMEADTGGLPNNTRASPITVQWLIDNYETAEGVSLPRSTLYNHYLRHCHDHKLEPMNPASFGKLIRSVFLGLRTRRLGTRGNSKYHYYGIRIKPNSPLNQFVEDQAFAMRNYPHLLKESMEADYHHNSRYSKNTAKYTASPHVESSMSGSEVTDSQATQASHPATTGSVRGNSDELNQHHQFLGAASSALPNLGELCRSAGLTPTDGITDSTVLIALPPDITQDHISTFTHLYAEHCEHVLSAVVNLNFNHLENLWQAFWRTSSIEDEKLEHRLPRERLYLLLELENVQRFILLSDQTFYQSLVEVLIPDVLRPIPNTLTQGIRNFAKSLELWMRQATSGLNADIVHIKMSAVLALAQILRRYTSLNHLAQAARAVLQNGAQIGQMLTDLNRVDFTNVQEQASWVCNCDDQTVTQLEIDFKKILQQQTPLEQWATWLDQVVTSLLALRQGHKDFAKAARQLILKWSFYSSMVIRDLTLRSAASFGSFHLIRLLYDEYIYYLVEHKVAAHKGITPVAVMGHFEKDNARQPRSDGFPENQAETSLVDRDAQVANSGVLSGSFSLLMEDNSECPQLTNLDGNQITSQVSETATTENVTSAAAMDAAIQAGQRFLHAAHTAIESPQTMVTSGYVTMGQPVTSQQLGLNSLAFSANTSLQAQISRKTVCVTTGDIQESVHTVPTSDWPTHNVTSLGKHPLTSDIGQSDPAAKILKSD